MRVKNVPVSGQIILEKSQNLATQLGVENFQASHVWLSKWKNRFDIKFKYVVGGDQVTLEIVAP